MTRSGATVVRGGVEFIVWAPLAEELKLHIVQPFDQFIDLQRDENGYASVHVEGIGAGTRYFYRIGSDDRPDPASRYQPEGVHGPSEVVDDRYQWKDASWRGIPLRDYVIYELHVGTFTPGGTLDDAVTELPRLRELGITAVEIMPVAQFPGTRNWGYDGVYPNAVQNSYGGPDALKRFVDAAHAEGLAVVLDVVYNHLGPEGNYFRLYAPYFTDVYKTPWGEAINFDGADSDEVRAFFIHSALQWCRDYHIDALRLDAVHAIIDRSAQPFLLELARAVHALAEEIGLPRYLIAESDMNDPRLLRSEAEGGFGLDAQWADDFHHALHVALTDETLGYYEDFSGVRDFPEILKQGWLFDGRFSPYRKRRYGAPARIAAGERFVVCAQNHDQVGNRMMGDRLAESLSFEELKLAVGLVLTSPFTPLLFMGEEYGEKAPFRYFTSHSDEGLIEAVRKGRAEEFAAFEWKGEVPDPHAQETFDASRLDRSAAGSREGVAMSAYTRDLLRLRRELPALRSRALDAIEAGVSDDGSLLWIVRRSTEGSVCVCVNFSERRQPIPLRSGRRLVLDSGASQFGGSEEFSDEPPADIEGRRLLIFEVG